MFITLKQNIPTVFRARPFRVVFMMCLCVFVYLTVQIVCALEQDDAARKQRLAFKLEQVVAFMSLES